VLLRHEEPVEVVRHGPILLPGRTGSEPIAAAVPPGHDPLVRRAVEARVPSQRPSELQVSALTRHFVDPSLAAAALGAGPARLLRDPETLGFLFESLVIRDLRIYGQAIGAAVFHYRENTGAEADAILQMRSGQWAALEVKLGQGDIDKGASSLLRVAANVDTNRHGKPAFLAVVTGWGYAYRRPDGVFVIPVGTLGS
jgi:sirohydrochlorin ferrochelatase